MLRHVSTKVRLQCGRALRSPTALRWSDEQITHVKDTCLLWVRPVFAALHGRIVQS